MGYYELKSQKREVYKKANTVESITELACPLSDIISLGAKVNLISSEKQTGGVNYKARIIFNVVYLLEGEVRRKEFGIELSDFCKIDNLDNRNAYVELTVEGVSAKRGEKLSLEGIVSTQITLEQTTQDNLVTDKENCLARVVEKPYNEPKGQVSQSFVIDDEQELDKELKNVLCSGAVAQIVTCQCGLGAIICDGEIVLSLALLPNQEKSDIIKENRIIPFRLELEESNISINDLACAKVKVNDVNLKVVVDEQRGKTTLACQIEVEICAKAFKPTTISFADDMFSLQNSLSLASENISINNFIKQKSFSERISGKAFCIPPENSRIICVLEERVYGVSYKCENGKLYIEGVASCYVTFENINSGAICSKLAEMPFAIEQVETCVVEDVNIICRSLQAKIRNDEVEIEGELLACYNTCSQSGFLAITSVEEGEPLEAEDCAFSIYSVQKSDTLWEVAKALRVSEQEILDQNEISLPFNGEEKIIIYKKA